VDVNPLASELAKVSLWLEAMEPGRPLAFLDAQIKVGNALIGTTPKLLEDGIPDDAFKPIEGDDKKIAAAVERRNKHEREHPDQSDLFGEASAAALSNLELAVQMRSVISIPSLSLADIAVQRQRLANYSDSPEYQHQKLIADTWCAAFVWSKTSAAPAAITERQFRDLLSDPGALKVDQRDEVDRLAAEYRFFHWHLEFPHLFPTQGSSDINPVTGWGGGFAAICANPPWDKVDFEDKKYFDRVNPEIANTVGSARRAKIAAWLAENLPAAARYTAARRKVKGTFHFAKKTGVFPYISQPVKGVNSIQLDHLFAEQMTAIVSPQGRFGTLIPTTIATGAGAQHLFKRLVDSAAISAIFDFDNREKLFPAVHSSMNFCVCSVSGRGVREPSMRLAFGLRNTTQLRGDRIFELTTEEIKRLNPNTRTLPTFQTRRDADITLGIYRRVPVLVVDDDPKGNPWHVTTRNLYNMTDDEHLFRAKSVLEEEGWRLRGNVFELDGKRMLPLYEAKMVDFYNHRAADVVLSETATNRKNQPRYLSDHELRDPNRLAVPLHWVPEFDVPTGEVDRRGRPTLHKGVASRLTEVNWDREWLIGWCDVTAATNERTAIAAFIPRTAVGHKFPLMFLPGDPCAAEKAVGLVACMSSFVFDFVSRQKIGSTSMGVFIWKQLPVLPWSRLQSHMSFLKSRVAELACTSADMAGLAADLGYHGTMSWDEARRATVRAEIDAYMFMLYEVRRDDLDYIMETFPIVKRKDQAAHGEYRTKRLILDAYDRLTA
jgi:hypothetical protein